MTMTCKISRPIQTTLFLGGTLVASLALGPSVLAVEDATAVHGAQPANDRLALGLNDRSDLSPGSFRCVNNGDPLCGNPGLYTSPWNKVPDGNHFEPDGFRGEFYDSVESGTGPSADQQSQLQDAMGEYNDYLETQNTAACINNPNTYCD
jgi:hypothetical protein